MVDEGYYGNPAVMKSFLDWPEYSFGHPPGWHYVHALVYSVLGMKAESLRILGLFFSTSFLLFIFSIGWIKNQLLPASVLMLFVVGHEYFRDFASFNHPVIATTLLGLAALFLAERKKWLAFSICLTLAIFLRESALAFVVASAFLLNSKNQIKYLIPPVGLFVFTYLWAYASKQILLMNNQVGIMLASGQAPFTFTFEKLGSHIHFILQLFPASFLVFALIGVPAVLIVKKQQWSPLASALLTVFTLHTLFFGFYTELGLRVTFIAAMALAFLVYLWMESDSKRHWVHSITLLLAGITTSFLLIHWAQNPTDRWARAMDEATVHRSMAQLIEPLVRNNKDLVILATNPYHEYLMFPWQGYTDFPMEAHWYGGSPGYMKLRDFDVGIVHLPLEWWPEQDIYKYAQDNNYELYHEVKGSSTTVQIWIRPGIKP